MRKDLFEIKDKAELVSLYTNKMTKVNKKKNLQ